MNKFFLWCAVFCCTFLVAQDSISYNFPKIKSSISMPVRVPLIEIANLVNGTVKDLVFEDNSYEDNNNDQFKVKVWKTRAIRFVGGTNQNLIIEVPLKIWAEKGIGTLGVYSYQSTTFETVMYFSTQIQLNTNWTIRTKTEPKGFKWVTKPVLNFGSITIPITNVVEMALVEQQRKFSTSIDQQMKTQLNFQNYALLAWNQFTRPFQISEEYDTWLKVTPLNVTLTPLQFFKDEINTTLGIDAYSETYTGKVPESSVPALKMSDFAFIPYLEKQFLLQTTANIPFSKATDLAEKMFLGKEYEVREGKSKVKITGIKVKEEQGRVVVQAETEGYVNGTSIISGVPMYDESLRKIILTDSKFILKTKNILQKTATLLFQKKIITLIEKEYGIPTQEIEISSKKSIEEAFNKDYYKGMKISGKVYYLKPTTVLVRPGFLTAVIDTKANLVLKMEGM